MKRLQHPGLSRRDFGRLVATLGALGCLEPHTLARALGGGPKRLSWMAYRTAGAEGVTPPPRLLYTREEYREVKKLQVIAHAERGELGEGQ